MVVELVTVSCPASTRTRRATFVPERYGFVRVRQWSDMPVIVLSAKALERRKVAALDGGANDYVTKPFGFAESEARIRSAVRDHRPGEAPQTNELVVGDLAFDLVHHQVVQKGKTVVLTAKEFDLLAYLARHVGKLCPHEMILASVWGEGYGYGTESLRVYIFRLRRKLGYLDGHLLRARSGLYYSLLGD
jgi:two-component system KDP operon response regulator KdpE